MTKKQTVRIALPQGPAAFAWLDKPDTGQKYSDDKFKVTMIYDSPDVLSEVEEACVKAAKEEWPSVKPADLKLPFQDGDDKEKEEFHGKTLVTLKSKFKPAQVDAKKNPLPADVRVMSGDVIRCAASLYCYEKTEKVKEGGKMKNVTVHGVSLQLLGVQLIEKRNMGGNGGTDLFDEEDGFVAETSDSDTTEDSGDGDF